MEQRVKELYMMKHDAFSFSNINSSEVQLESIDAVRDRLLNTAFIVSAIFGIIAVAAVLFRNMAIGQQIGMGVYLSGGTFFLAFVIFLFLRRIPYNIKALIISSAWFIGAIIGLFEFGLIGMGIPTLITSCILVTIFLGSRFGLAALVSSIGVIAIIGVGVQLEQIDFKFDMSTYAVNPSSWIFTAICAAFFIGLIVVTLGRLHTALAEAIVALNKRSSELYLTNEQLRGEIIERKKAEEALKESEERLIEAQEMGKIGHWEYDLQSETTTWSDQIYRLYERAPNLGPPHFKEELEIYVPEDRDKIYKEALRILETGESIIIDLRAKLPSGRLAYFCSTFHPTRDEDGHIIKLNGTVQDITERKQAEEELKKSEEKYRELANLLPQVVFEADEKGTLTFVNRYAYDAFGYTEKDFEEGLNAFQMLISKDRDFAWEKMQRTMSGEKSVGTEYTALRQDGGTFPALIYATPIINEGRPVGIRGMIADLTELKRTQAALKESEEKLARLKKMEALGLLAGGVAHDLNNVLAGIVSIPDILLEDLPKDSKVRKPLEIMQDAGKRAAAIVEDLLTVARGVATPKEPLNINDIVREYLNSPEFEKLRHFHPSVTVKTNLDPHLFNTNGSNVHFRKVIMNLVSNASEAIEGSGNVVISTTNRYIDKPLKGYEDVNMGEYVILSVSDDGSGLSPEDLEKIFDPFYSKKIMGKSGTGLGLTVVWNVIQDHNGYIDVISGEGGTTFELYFPITRNEFPEKILATPVKDLKGNGETILVVDDVEKQREISCQMLDVLGYKPFAISSGEDAVEYLKEHTVDLILLDMIMDPGINGRETYERIVKIHPNQKAVIVSGFVETDEVKKAQKLGAGQYLKKPLTLEKIGLAIKEELNK